ncbi:MAG: hypothetical protein ACK41Y_16720, partial [Paracoccus hibiscisoli]|uniref:hypothetical protein n=1 Tax=Paracoccus hibiscisoli TaxID=2023261 RepID=UPI00391DF26A
TVQLPLLACGAAAAGAEEAVVAGVDGTAAAVRALREWARAVQLPLLQALPWVHRLGLGATANPWTQKEKRRGPGDKPRAKSSKLADGAVVGVRHGDFKGNVATVTKSGGVPGLDQVLVRVEGYDQDVSVGKRDLQLLADRGDVQRFLLEHPHPRRPVLPPRSPPREEAPAARSRDGRRDTEDRRD